MVELDKQDTKDLLLLSAKSIFAEKGYEGATVKNIADQAEVNVSLISYHFGGKEGLYRALVQSLGSRRLDVSQRLLAEVNTQEEFKLRLRMFVEDFMRVNLEDMDFMRIIQRDFDGGHPLALEVFRKIFIDIFGLISGFFEKAKNKGLINPQVDVHMAASLALGSLVHNLRMDFLRREMFGCCMEQKDFFERFINQFVSIFCNGMLEHQE